MIKSMIVIIVLGILSFLNLAAQDIVINEVMASNSESYLDEYLNSPDWIELYNAGSKSVNLKGYRISDKNKYDDAWILPDTIIEPNETLLILASGESRNNSNSYIIEASGHGVSIDNQTDGMRFYYIPVKGDFELIVNINSIRNYSSRTHAGIMIRDNMNEDSKYAAILSQNPELNDFHFLFRTRERAHPNLSYFYNILFEYPKCTMKLKKVGDSITAYVLIDEYKWHTQYATVSLNFNDEESYLGLVFSSGNNNHLSKFSISQLELNGKAIHINQFQKQEINSSLYGREYQSTEIHSNFQLDRDGGEVYLWDETGILLDTLEYPALQADISFGRNNEEADVFNYFYPSSPESENTNPYKGICNEPEFSNNGGFFQNPQEIYLGASDSISEIYYTLDGSQPKQFSHKYNGSPIVIDTTTVIRACCFRDNYLPSTVISNTYFIKDNSELDILSLSIDSVLLWNNINGIFREENLFKDIEIPVSFEFWGKDKTLLYEANAGAKLHGQLSRTYPQKSFKIYAKGKYGTTVFPFKFFDSKGLDAYQSIVLRNGGTDWKKSLIRDGYSAVISEQLPNIDAMAYRPTVMFLNGNFYGIQNIRERIDENYLSKKNNIPLDGIDLLDDWGILKYGSIEDYSLLQDSLDIIDFEQTNGFRFIERNIDIKNIIDFVFIELFMANIDWPWKNMKFWKSKFYDNKWRWIINDLDYTCGVNSFPEINMMPLLTNKEDSFSKLFTSFLSNETFRNLFINRSADLLNTIFLPNNLITKLDSLVDIIKGSIPRQQAKYDSSAVNWNDEIDIIRDFVSRRNMYYSNQYLDYFNLADTCSIVLKVYPKDAGRIKISTIIPDNYPWQGRYFLDVPVNIIAIPNNGYSFAKWSDNRYSGNQITILFSESTELEAIFAKNDEALPLVINEIMYRPADNKDCKDWFEIYNPNNYAVSLTGYTFKDDNDEHIYRFPDNSFIEGNGYLVVAENPDEFNKYYQTSCDVLGPLDFGLGKQDKIRLFDIFNQKVDSVDYSNEAPWPAGSDRTGRSIELTQWDKDNNVGSNWLTSFIDLGTPCMTNSIINSIAFDKVLTYDSQIAVYPNPATTWININFLSNVAGNSSLSIYDIHGYERVRKSGIITETGTNNVEADIQALETGIYILQINTGESILTCSLRVIR